MVVNPRREIPEDFDRFIEERRRRIEVFDREVTLTAKHIDSIADPVFLVDMGCWLGVWTERLRQRCRPLAAMWLMDASKSFVRLAAVHLAGINAHFTPLTIALDDEPVKLNAVLDNTLFYTSTRRPDSPQVVNLDSGPRIDPDSFARLVAILPRPLFLKVDINCWEREVVISLLKDRVAVDGFQIKVDSDYTLDAVARYLDWLAFLPTMATLPEGEYGTLISSKVGTTMLLRTKSTGDITRCQHSSDRAKIEAWAIEAFDLVGSMIC